MSPVIPRKLHRHIQLSHVHKVYAILSRTPEGPFLTIKADLHFALNPQPPGHKLPIFFSLSPNFFCQSFAHPVSPQPALLFLPSNEIPPTFSLNLFFWCKKTQWRFSGKRIKWILIVDVIYSLYSSGAQPLFFWPRWKISFQPSIVQPWIKMPWLCCTSHISRSSSTRLYCQSNMYKVLGGLKLHFPPIQSNPPKYSKNQRNKKGDKRRQRGCLRGQNSKFSERLLRELCMRRLRIIDVL